MLEATRKRYDHEPAFVLHSYPYRETSLIVEVFAQHHGRLALIARGARRPRSVMRGVLLAFQPLLLSWAGKTELRTLHKAEWVGGLPQPKGNALLCGFYLNELMLKLLPHDAPHEQLFEDYRHALQALNADGATRASAAAHAATLRYFEKRLLKELGYALTLDKDAETGAPIRADRQYYYVPERGAVLVKSTVKNAGKNTPHHGRHENTLEFSGRTLLDMEADDYSHAGTQAQSKALMRMLINHYLGNQSLNTRQLLQDLQQL